MEGSGTEWYIAYPVFVLAYRIIRIRFLPLLSGYNLNIILRIQKSRDKMVNNGSSCIACGGKAEKRARVTASSCSALLKGYLSRRCQDNATEIDLDAVIKASYM